MPDISLLPLLANLFEVTTDFLLGVNIDAKEGTIREILDQAEACFDNGHSREAERILRAALRDYPRRHEIMRSLLYVLGDYPYAEDEAYDEETANAYNNEIIAIGEKLLAESRVDSIRHAAIQLLCLTYPKVGMTDQAERLAKSMPSWYLTDGCLLRGIYSGTKRYRQTQANIMEFFNALLTEIDSLPYNVLDDGSRPYSDEEAIAILKKKIDLAKILLEDGDLFFFEQVVADTYTEIAARRAELSDHAGTIETLRLAAEYAVQYDRRDLNLRTIRHTSLIFQGYERKNWISQREPKNQSLRQLEQMREKRYDFVREDAAFAAIEHELKKSAKPL